MFDRKDTKTLCLKNKTMLPVAWHLTGLDALSDDFSVSQEGGVIQPKSEFVLSVYFRALKPIVTNRKAIRIEVNWSISFFVVIIHFFLNNWFKICSMHLSSLTFFSISRNIIKIVIGVIISDISDWKMHWAYKVQQYQTA